MSKFVIVDNEADGAYPIDYSIVCFGAIVVEPELNRTFYGQCAPISNLYQPDALAISGFTREQHLRFDDPQKVFGDFRDWLDGIGERIVFLSDNLAFDWQWTNTYLHKFAGRNPFGFSGRRINDIYSGAVRDLRASNNWKKLRKTKHTHNPVDDARGNAEAFIQICKEYNL